jgi:predicted RNase H-like HicB family nuclease
MYNSLGKLLKKLKRRNKMKKSHHILLTVTFTEEKDKTWIANCEELGTSTFGDSFEEVKEEINELIILHLNTLEKLGERKKFFKENGITLYTKHVPDDIKVTTPVRGNTFVNTFAHELACV